MEYTIILASGSPRRKEIMNMIGAKYIVIPSNKDESMDNTDPAELVRGLSKMKALDVAEKTAEEYPNSVIIGCDTVVAAGNQILGKPHTSSNAFKMVKDLQGSSHEVHTGVTIIVNENSKIKTVENFSVASTVRVSSMTDEEISEYVATGESLDKAGAYAIQGLFCRYIEGIEGDYYNIVGYPINAINQTFKKLGIRLA